jgi:hypothetical protein
MLEIEEYKKRIENLKKIRESNQEKDNSRSNNNNNHRSSGYKHEIKPKNRLTEEEKAQRLKEMEDNAKWRESVRNKNIKTYKNESKKDAEEEEMSKSANSQKDASNLFK